MAQRLGDVAEACGAEGTDMAAGGLAPVKHWHTMPLSNLGCQAPGQSAQPSRQELETMQIAPQSGVVIQLKNPFDWPFSLSSDG